MIGRFYSNDPVGAVAHLNNAEGIRGFNLYSYAINNPYKYTDPDGKQIRPGPQPPPRAANKQQILAGVKDNLEKTSSVLSTVALVSSAGGRVANPATVAAGALALAADVTAAQLGDSPVSDTTIAVASALTGSKVAKKVSNSPEAISGNLEKAEKQIVESIGATATEATSQTVSGEVKNQMKDQTEK